MEGLKGGEKRGQQLRLGHEFWIAFECMGTRRKGYENNKGMHA
jgi:hypothetical protein